ncbi:hypothetical protein FHR83_004183 [Actinoplanes campanulatus]|uniref:Uncharacterized protein n=1 Tax=Actinoplanes campanulatus TaxID=113559 RepID=A0A7W5AHU4_9ACTN|nr:DUF6346 domain-containing protein [Actinoplanes campanulatus]MBB3096513.1 hypothetical protein [Actinoplanes campanulatus]GGN17734.1 hypothetical protein GCM10010109_30560 [Actinoplanes campanulatus]GID38580.1 hypothetical protein Aca09nite_50860 [Actinoplanes campanulatus]
MGSDDDWRAKYRARIRALEAEQAQAEAELSVAAAGPDSDVVDGRGSRPLRDVSFLLAIIMLSGIVLLAGMTLVRSAGRDFDDARRAGWATVDRCRGHGPVTGKGFGYWETCDVTIRWDDGTTGSLTKDGVFTSADIGSNVRVGDLGRYRTSTELAKQDAPYRPWLKWIGVFVALAGLLPGLFALLIVRGFIRDLFRIRRR